MTALGVVEPVEPTERRVPATDGPAAPGEHREESPLSSVADRVAAWRPASPNRLVVVLVLVFAFTRLLAGAVADHPVAYGDPQIDPGHDVVTYQGYARATLDRHQTPYGDLDVEYPPGALAAIDAPHLAAPHLHVSYRTAYILAMVLVDALGLLLLVRLARRTGHWHGALAWVLVVPLLGPVVYTRFDLLPAVLTLWAVERASAGRWRAAGALLGLGVVTKVYAVFLLPQVLVVATRRRQVLTGAAVAAAVVLVPFVTQLGPLLHDLQSTQGQRGLHWESTFGSLVMVAHALGYPAVIVTEFGAVDVVSDVSRGLTMASSLLSLAIVVLATRHCARVVQRGSAAGLSLSMFGTMGLLVGFGFVYSPQYVLWILALGAVTLGLTPRPALPAFAVLVAVVVLSHLVYPVLWRGLSTNEPLSLVVLVARNALTIAVGALALKALPRVETGTVALQSRVVHP